MTQSRREMETQGQRAGAKGWGQGEEMRARGKGFRMAVFGCGVSPPGVIVDVDRK